MIAVISHICARILIEIHHGTETSFPHFPSTTRYYQNTLPKYVHRSRRKSRQSKAHPHIPIALVSLRARQIDETPSLPLRTPLPYFAGTRVQHIGQTRILKKDVNCQRESGQRRTVDPIEQQMPSIGPRLGLPSTYSIYYA